MAAGTVAVGVIAGVVLGPRRLRSRIPIADIVAFWLQYVPLGHPTRSPISGAPSPSAHPEPSRLLNPALRTTNKRIIGFIATRREREWLFKALDYLTNYAFSPKRYATLCDKRSD